MITTLIFDFDGTICDSYLATVRIMNELAPSFGYNVVPESEFEKLKGQNFDTFKKTLGISGFKIPFVLRRGRKLMLERIKTLKAIDGLPEALLELKKQGVALGVLSSNSKRNVEAFLAHNGLLEHFDFVYGESSLFGKARLLKKLLRRERLEAKTVAYVGDEARDVRAAKAVGIASIAVLWGFNTAALLEEAAPDVVISHPSELLTVLN